MPKISKENIKILYAILERFEIIDNCYDDSIIDNNSPNQNLSLYILALIKEIISCIEVLKSDPQFDINIFADEELTNFMYFSRVINKEEPFDPIQLKIFVCEIMPHIENSIKKSLKEFS